MTRSRITHFLKAGAALAAITAAGPLLAQEQSVENPQTPEEVAAAANDEAAPQEAAGADAALIGEDILVTARRREESLQDVPIAVTAFSGEAWRTRARRTSPRCSSTTPNPTVQVARGSNSTLIAFIRGVGQQDPLWGFEPGVGLYIDDVYVARPQGAVLDIFDVERIEVLRGPQGTLYGRNTIGGAIKYVTRRIGKDSEARAPRRSTAPTTRSISAGPSTVAGQRQSGDRRSASPSTTATASARTSPPAPSTTTRTSGPPAVSLEWHADRRPCLFRLPADTTVDELQPAPRPPRGRHAALAAFEPPASVYDTRAGRRRREQCRDARHLAASASAR